MACGKFPPYPTKDSRGDKKSTHGGTWRREEEGPRSNKIKEMKERSSGSLLGTKKQKLRRFMERRREVVRRDVPE
jgi:hypothetical protein